MKKFWMSAAMILACAACEIVEYHPYDVDVPRRYKNTNANNIGRIETALKEKNEVRFVLMGDSQRFYDETRDFVNSVNERGDVDFVIHGGDVSDFGLKKEFVWVHDIMSMLTVPYVTLIGNHDILGNGLSVYRTIYGDLNFSFTAARTRFVCLNTNALEFDYSVPVPDFIYIDKEVDYTNTSTDVDRTVVVMHADPFGEQFNNNVAVLFQEQLREMKNLQMCLHAHAHRLLERDIFEDGIMYYGCAAMNSRSYMIFTINSNGISHEVVNY